MPLITGSVEQSIETSHWVGWADQDYLGARVLLLSGFVVQGTTQAATAVEKYLKAVCTLSNTPFKNVKHNVSKLNGLLHSRGIKLDLDAEFLKLLNKAFELRYPDELGVGFNVALNSIAILVQLDSSVQRIRRGFTFFKPGRVATTRLDHALATRATELVTKNCAFGDASKEMLFAEPSWSYELRVFPHRGIMEVSYVTEKIAEDGNFRRTAMTPVPGSDGRSFNLAWLPKQEAPQQNA
jgi:hypothetical protein